MAAAHSDEPRFVLQDGGELLYVECSATQQVDENPGVDCARAGPHHQAVEWREAHRRPDRRPAGDGRDRAAAAEVGDDELELIYEPAEELGGPANGPFHREPVEPEPSDARAGPPLRGDRVAGGDLRQPRMEGRVETGDMRAVRDESTSGRHRLQRDVVVKGRQLADRGDLSHDVVVDQDRLRQPLAAMDDAMHDCGQSRRFDP